MEMQNMEQSQNSLARLNQAVEGLISKIQKQQADFETALTQEKEKYGELLQKDNLLQEEVQRLKEEVANRDAQMVAQQEKISAMEATSGSESEALKEQLTQKTQQYDVLNAQYMLAQQKLEELQQAINQTSENIDGVVAKLEKVLAENGAGYNND